MATALVSRYPRPIGIGILVVICAVVICWLCCWPSSTTVLLVRHADRLGTQDALAPAGVTRAQELVHVLEKSGLSAIYHTEALRTQQTATPLATALGITPVQIAAADTTALVSAIQTQHRGETVLVVGHSNTVPQIVAALGGSALANISESEFDNLFVLQRVCRCGCLVKLVNLQYGAASP